jgi:CheY-like chemotaxis protein
VVALSGHEPEPATHVTFDGGVTLINVCIQVSRSSAEATVQQSSRRLRILLVDDDLMVPYSVRHILEHDGHVVTATDSGQEGIDAFTAALAQGAPFSVVITDLGMPRVHGWKLAESIKAVSAQTPVILLTAWAEQLLASKELPPHIDRIVGKPPRLAELRAALANVRCPPVELLSDRGRSGV